MMLTPTNGSSHEGARETFDDEALNGESLPLLDARDEARLLVQSPRRLFLYWNLADDQRAVLRRAFGDLAARFETGARLVDLEHHTPGAVVAAGGGEVWFDTSPHRPYRAEVGFYAEGLPFVRVLASNVVRTPADEVSDVTDDSADFQLGAAYMNLLPTISGFGDAARTDVMDANVGQSGASGAALVSPVSSFALTKFAPSSFVLGGGAPEHRD
ncbi:MAG: DUF4912 domain-containing protein [Pyrinomonadaceae bacterium]